MLDCIHIYIYIYKYINTIDYTIIKKYIITNCNFYFIFFRILIMIDADNYCWLFLFCCTCSNIM